MIRILIAGEGANELGGRAGERAYWTGAPGVIEALLRQVRADGWEVTDALQWKDIRKYRAGDRKGAETRNVLGAVQAAKESKCDVIAFVRDRDGTHRRDHREREAAVELGIEKAAMEVAQPPGIIGGVAIEKLESWLLAIHGQAKSETVKQPVLALEEQGVDPKNTARMVALIEEKKLARIPEDAVSLERWLTRARAAL